MFIQRHRYWRLPILALALSAAVIGHGQPEIYAPPSSSLTVDLAQTATLTITAYGIPPLNYQWTKDGSPLGDGPTPSGSTVMGSASATLSISGTTASDAGNYTVAVTDGNGATATGPIFQLATKPPMAPAIIRQPADATVELGRAVTLSVAADGSYPRTYQWFFNGAPIMTFGSDTLILTSAGLSDAGSYSVTVTNAYGSARSTVAKLNVIGGTPPILAYSPSSTTLYSGQIVELNVGLESGSFPLRYQWRKNGAPILGATTAAYSIPAAGLNDAGAYSVVVSNSFGQVASQAATVIVNPAIPPAFVTQPLSASVVPSNSIALTTTVTGSAPLSYQWRKDGEPIFGVANAPSLTFDSVQSSDAGSYTLAVTNAGGTVVSQAAVLTVLAPQVATLGFDTLGETKTASLGSLLTLLVPPITSGSPPYAYQWYRNGLPVRSTILSMFSIPSIKAGDLGDYLVVVTNSAGSVTGFPIRVAQPGAGPAPKFTAAVPPSSNDNLIPDAILEDRNGVVYMLNRLNERIQRWSPASRSYLSPIALQGNALTLAYSATKHRLYCAYLDGRVTKIELDGPLHEEPFLALPGDFVALRACDNYVFVNVQDRNSNNQHMTVFDASGTAQAVSIVGVYPSQYAWSSANHALYSASANGTVAAATICPPGALFPGDGLAQSSNLCFPSPDGRLVATDTGALCDGITLARTGTLSNAIADGAWEHGELYTVRAGGRGTEVQAWQPPDFRLDAAAELTGAVDRILALPGEELLVVTATPQGPVLTVLNRHLQVEYQSDSPSAAADAPGWITLPEPRQAAYVGSVTTLAISTSGARPQRYQWFKNGVPLAGATDDTLEIGPLAATDAALYTVTAANRQAAIISPPVKLDVFAPTAITRQPQDQTAPTGTAVTLGVAATGAEPWSCQWLKDGTPISGADSATLTFDPAQIDDSGVYTARLTERAGTVVSRGAKLLVGSPSVPAFYQSLASTTLPAGGHFSINPSAYAQPPATAAFFFNGQRLVGIASQIDVDPVSPAYAGTYTTIESNIAGTAESSTKLTIAPPASPGR